MGGIPEKHRRTAATAAAMAAVLAVLAACSAGGGSAAGTGAPKTTAGASQRALPVTAEINQLRDNYSKQIVSIQLTNTSDGAFTVLGARLRSALFATDISWQPAAGGIELPPGQTKSLPAQLPAPVCGQPAGQPGHEATVELQLAAAPETAAADTATPEMLPAPDPFAVLNRNNAEMCLAQSAAAVADFQLDPGLDVTPDGQAAVVRLLITPRRAGPSAAAGSLTILRIEGTPLLAEDPSVPWPRDFTVRADGNSSELQLGIRPARCDPHAVAEDKVGTLLPLRVTLAGRDGVLKVAAVPLLRGRIYDFVTAACGRQ